MNVHNVKNILLLIGKICCLTRKLASTVQNDKPQTDDFFLFFISLEEISCFSVYVLRPTLVAW